MWTFFLHKYTENIRVPPENIISLIPAQEFWKQSSMYHYSDSRMFVSCVCLGLYQCFYVCEYLYTCVEDEGDALASSRHGF